MTKPDRQQACELLGAAWSACEDGKDAAALTAIDAALAILRPATVAASATLPPPPPPPPPEPPALPDAPLLLPSPVSPYVAAAPRQRRRKSVESLDGRWWPDAWAAAAELGVSFEYVRQACNGNKVTNVLRGARIRYSEFRTKGGFERGVTGRPAGAA